MEDDISPNKEQVALSLLERGNVFLHIDPRLTGVVVPPWLNDQPQLVLQVGMDMPVPIPNLHVDEEGVSGTLSFNRSPFACFIGWDAVFALAGDDGRGMVWPESLPPEIADEIDRETGRSAPLAFVAEPEEEVNNVVELRVVKAQLQKVSADETADSTKENLEGEGQTEPPMPSSGKKRPPYLKIIK